MKKKITALVLACLMALPIGNVTVYGTETAAPASAVQTVTEEGTASDGVVDATQTDPSGAAVTGTAGTGSETVTDGTQAGENAGETESVTETESEAPTEDVSTAEPASDAAPEKYKEHLSLPGFSYHDGKLWYQDAELDENGCYAYTDQGGRKLLFDSLDPEFPETYAAIKKNKVKTTADGVQVSNSALGANTGDIYMGLNGAQYAHPAGANGKDVLHGIDVSYAQGYINWAGMKQSGVQFAIIRSGARGYGAEGNFINDTYFTTNMANAAAQGMKIGVYFFSQAVSEAEAIAEADLCYQQIMSSGYKSSVTLPVYIDYEYAEPNGAKGGRMYNARLTPAQHTAICNAFCARMNQYGFQSGIYANKDMILNDMVYSGIPTNYSIWMANWQNVTSYTGRLDCWQYHVSTALANWVSNATKTVDLDFGYWAGTALSAAASANPATLTMDLTKNEYVETKLTGSTNKTGSTFAWTITMSDGASAAGAYTQTTPVTSGTTNTSTLRFTKPGTYKATVTVTKGNEKSTASVLINVKCPLQEEWFSTQSNSFTYDGKEHEIKDFIKTTALAPNGNAFYNVYYQKSTVTKLKDVLRNAEGNVIPYDVTIVGTGACTGTLTRQVLVNPRNIGGGDCVITVPEVQEYVPTASALQMTVVDNGIFTTDKNGTKIPTTLECGTDYVIGESEAVKLGTIYVTVEGAGNYAGTLRSPNPIEIETSSLSDGMIATIPDQIFEGGPLTPALEVSQSGVTLTEGQDYSVAYENNVNVGTATATITGLGLYTGTATASFKIKAKPLTEDMLVAVPDQFFTGAAIKLDTGLTPVLKNMVTGNPLVLTTNNKDGDFRITYAANTNVGTATITMTGLNNYSGSVKGSFKIVPADINAGDVTVLLANTEDFETVYTGKEIKPAVKVMRNGKAVAATQYAITYQDNTNVGEASVVLTGKGNYGGTNTTTFTINPKALSLNGKAGTGISYGTIAAKTYTSAEPQGMKPLPVVKYGGTTLVEGVDYALTYDKVMTNEKGAVVYDAAKQPVIDEQGLERITEAGTYRAVLTAEDGNYEGEYVYPSVFKVNPAKIAAKNVVMENAALKVGNPDPGIKVAVDGVELVKGTEYEITYVLGKAESDEPTVPGRYTVRVDGIGNYQGRVNQTLTVYDASTVVFDTADFDISLPDDADFDYSFDNTPKKPPVTVTNRSTGAELVLNKDYSLAYADNKNVGTATVKLTGKGAQKGTIIKTFTIKPCEDVTLSPDVNKLSFSVNKESFVFNGRVQKALPVVKLMTVDAKTGKAKVVATLKSGTDYTADYENANSRDAGDYDITINLKGNYSGSETVSYEIAPYEVSRLTVSVPVQYYDGMEKTPDLSAMTIRCGGVLMTDEDKEGLSIDRYDNNINVGSKAQVTISAEENNGNFTNARTERSGTIDLPKVQYFTINRRTVADKSLVITVGGAAVSDKNVSEYKTVYEEELDAKGKRVAVGQEPEVVIKDAAGNELEQNVDYKVTYAGNKNVGKGASVTITGIGGNTGSRRITFEITGKDISEVVPLRGESIALTSVKLYKTAAGAKKADASDLVKDDSYVYSAAQIRPVPVAEYQDPMIGTVSLVSGTDYVLQYVNNVDAGTATVRLTGKGRYTGVVEKTFKINPVTESWLKANKKTVTISDIPTQTYTGKVVVPNVTVTAAGRKLTKGKDYTVNVTNSVRLSATGYATLQVSGIRNYSGMLGTPKNFKLQLAKPVAPTLTSTGVVKGRVDASWTAVPGANRYYLEWSSSASFPANDCNGTEVENTTWAQARCGTGKKYFRVQAIMETTSTEGKLIRLESPVSATTSVTVK